MTQEFYFVTQPDLRFSFELSMTFVLLQIEFESAHELPEDLNPYWKRIYNSSLI